MESRPTSRKPRRLTKTAGFVLIVAAPAAAGTMCGRRAPHLNLYAQDLLMRARGGLAVFLPFAPNNKNVPAN
ncbi:MAG TPA: hypothetical protein VGC76_01150 [Pyrinomonadaceae bacterium]|jgi:hypothetical protein